MYGFKPRHAQGNPVQNLADGGIVHSLTGMLGMRKRTPEELRAADAKNQARNQEAATAAAGRAQAAPEPAAKAAPAKAISEYSGMSAMQRREKEQGLADGGTVKPRGFKAGGMIRGPGTGTSDSIETEKRPGTFIMPADSTQAIGPEALEELGEVESDSTEEQGEKMPVRLSNGEFELPPEQVQALGEAVLTVMRNATHQPAGEQGEAPTGKGFTPHQFFASGGTVQDEEQQRLANQTAMYVRGAQEAAANRPPEPAAPQQPAPTADPQSGQAAFGVFPQLGRNSAGTPAKTAAPQATAPVPATQVDGWRTKAVMDGAAEDAQAAWDRGGAEGVAGAAGAVARGAITAVPTAIGEFAYNTVAPLASTAKGFWNGVTGGSDNAPGIAQAPVATPAAKRPAAPAAAPTTAQLPDARSPVGMSVADAQKQGLVGERVGYDPAYDQRLTGAPGQNGAVTRNGNSYAGTNVSGDITVNGQAPGGGAVSAQNMAAADALATRQTPAGFQPSGSQPAGVQAPVVRNSTNDWAARNNLRNASVSASSITNNGGEFDRSGPGDSAAMAEYKAALATDQAMQSAQPGMDQAAMREDAGIQREGMQQDGATARTGMQEQGANTRDAGRTALARDEFGLRKDAAGFQTRAATRLDGLQTRYEAETDPVKRADLAKQLREIQGKEQTARYKVAAGGQQIDANGVAYKVPDRVFNEQTGQFSDGTGAAPTPAAPRAGETRNGYRFKGGNPNDQANWAKV